MTVECVTEDRVRAIVSEELRRAGRRSAALTGAVVTLAVAVLGYLGTVRSAEINATARDQAAAVATATVERDDALVRRIALEAANLASERAEARTREAMRLEVAALRRDVSQQIQKREPN